ncbi:SNF2 family N-terminal domain-containing protein [Hypoxylon cercidicola]|nr:SNF2 family N-terminal domain-containing protein [Hypoxylon cercidicola]
MGPASSSLPRRDSASGTPGTSRKAQPGSRAQNSSVAYIEVDDDDTDELANDSIPCSSPYFTQPTQLISRTTQPTQIVNRTTLGMPSSPLVPSTPSRAIEVPASSPFQPKNQATPVSDKKPGMASRVGSLMAPAGTSYRPPAMRQAPQRPNKAAVQKDYLEISDDDLLADYKNHDSSEDERPSRGDIRPSSFVKKGNSLLSSKPEVQSLDTDISLNDIRDIRLRHLTRQVYNIVRDVEPGVTVQACKEALQKDFSWQVSKAVDYLTGRPIKTLSSSKPTGAPDDGPRGTGTNCKVKSEPTLNTTKKATADPQKSLHPFFKRTTSDENSSNSQASTQQSHSQHSNGPIVPSKPVPRKRLVQKRRASPTAPEIFSLTSSATSLITTPDDSRKASPTMSPIGVTRTFSPSPEAKPQPRRGRLMRGRRQRTPSPVAISSDSETELAPVQKISIRRQKRDAETEAEPRQQKRAKLERYSTESSSSETEQEESTKALEYLNTCTVEALGRMIGSVTDAKLMVSSRPFKRISQAKMVYREEKSKAKAKTKNKVVGEYIVEKLDSWFEACDAATAVIDECEARGVVIQDSMSEWAMDRNGIPNPNANTSKLPISEKPKLMSEDIALKSYQLVGLNWMSLLHAQGYGGILADDMGLGKTCQIISFIAHLVESGHGRGRPNLIVVPASTYENWISEFEKFAPGITVLPYSGQQRRDIDPEDAKEHDVVLTTYPQVERKAEDLSFLKKIRPYAAIFDEGHKLKNKDTLIYKQMMQVPTKLRLILSGTPVQNNLKELLTMLRFIEPSLFEEESFETLNTIFEAKVASKDVFNFAALASERVSRARAVMTPFILQRRKEDVIDLPKKLERVEVVGMLNTQKEIYNSIKSKIGSNGKSKDAHPWMQLRKAAIHDQLFRRHFDDSKVKKMVDILWKKCSAEELWVQNKEDRYKTRLLEDYMTKSDFALHLVCKEFEKYIGHLDIPHRSWEKSPKVEKLLELIRGYQKTGDRVLVFSRFEMVIDILRETLHFADIPYCCLTGMTETAERFPECQRFTDDPNIPVFLLTTGAGGTGLNLTAANKIILFDQSDNPQDDVQATNRAHRIGQTREVEVIRFITEKSVEVLIYNSGVKKLALASSVEQQSGAAPQDEESVEEQCKKRMILGGDETEELEPFPASQHV